MSLKFHALCSSSFYLDFCVTHPLCVSFYGKIKRGDKAFISD
jgi:hypothetical protein